MRGFVGIGSNRGARLAALERGVRACRAAGWSLRGVSSAWESAPAEGVAGGPFLNAVADFDGPESPEAWMRVLQAAEHDAGRRRRASGEARTLDLDLLWLEGVRLERPDLHVPHPRARGRAFVVLPWAEIAPGLCPFGPGESLDSLADGFSGAAAGAVPRIPLRPGALRAAAVAPAESPPV